MFKKLINDRKIQLEILMKEEESFLQAVGIVESSIGKGGKIIIFGNGGSATQSSHLAAELVNKFYFNRGPLPALALTSDIANLTAIGNDLGYRYIFSRQLDALAKPDDVALGISTSGRSPNVLEALKRAKQKNLKTIALCGNFTDTLTNMAVDSIISIKSEDTPLIQELHLFILHILAQTLEKSFFGQNPR